MLIYQTYTKCIKYIQFLHAALQSRKKWKRKISFKMDFSKKVIMPVNVEELRWPYEKYFLNANYSRSGSFSFELPSKFVLRILYAYDMFQNKLPMRLIFILLIKVVEIIFEKSALFEYEKKIDSPMYRIS